MAFADLFFSGHRASGREHQRRHQPPCPILGSASEVVTGRLGIVSHMHFTVISTRASRTPPFRWLWRFMGVWLLISANKKASTSLKDINEQLPSWAMFGGKRCPFPWATPCRCRARSIGFFRSGYVRKKTETLPPRWRPNESRIFKTLLSARGLPRTFRILGGVGEASALR